jgi:hypothetical protein
MFIPVLNARPMTKKPMFPYSNNETTNQPKSHVTGGLAVISKAAGDMEFWLASRIDSIEESGYCPLYIHSMLYSLT